MEQHKKVSQFYISFDEELHELLVQGIEELEMQWKTYNEEIEKRLEVTKQIKQELKKLVPEYMIPKKIIFLDEMPLNNNGKIDKKKLKELV